MATCEACGREVPSIEVQAMEVAGQLHYLCSEQCQIELLAQLTKPPVAKAEAAELEHAPRPEGKKRGRPKKMPEPAPEPSDDEWTPPA
jgi:hypothetical protein